MGLRARFTTPRRRREFLRGYAFPATLPAAVREHLPGLGDEQVTAVMRGLRDWFVLCQVARDTLIGMPSKAVDAAWHEFILMTREYSAFCDGAFGRYLHHTPEAQLRISMDEALARTAHIARTAGARAPEVPPIFTLDAQLGLPGAMRWTPESFEALATRGAAVIGPEALAGSPGCGGG